MGLRTPSYVATALRVSAGYRSDACKNYGAHAVGSRDGCVRFRCPPPQASGSERGAPVELMCFSPEADFAAAAVVGVVGIATARSIRTRRELIVGALPALFALHQFSEGFVWLGVRGQVSGGLGDAATQAWIVYAYAILPIIVPVGFMLLEPVERHRRVLYPFVALGAGVGLFLLWQVTQYPVAVTEGAHCLSYQTHTPDGTMLAVLYVAATCLPALLSSRPYLRWFGAVNLVAVAVAATVQRVGFVSIWCLYAALASMLILEHFRRQLAPDRQRAQPAPA
jgi:hypothetical protein